ncbi:hypothetical protein FZ983_32270 [Azospirillum sp. B21]|uniref:hypothetical protein n=1 Tax=Azospirillum sp. B21 TaxID=2607496 RepID=UPI0011EF56AE|nr:hypothetical protein [Azospirillum sp. B21]KAA0572248.1 hypothetical protein FZ983_32270 [Azospirillum sp. B21]
MRHSRTHLERAVEAFNADTPPGTPVTVRTFLGRRITTRTASKASLTGDRPGVWLMGVRERCDLSRVVPA